MPLKRYLPIKFKKDNQILIVVTYYIKDKSLLMKNNQLAQLYVCVCDFDSTLIFRN